MRILRLSGHYWQRCKKESLLVLTLSLLSLYLPVSVVATSTSNCNYKSEIRLGNNNNDPFPSTKMTPLKIKKEKKANDILKNNVYRKKENGRISIRDKVKSVCSSRGSSSSSSLTQQEKEALIHSCFSSSSFPSFFLKQRGGGGGSEIADSVESSASSRTLSATENPSTSSGSSSARISSRFTALKSKMMLPITKAEAPKFFALSIMMFNIIYIFTMTRDTKDTLIVTSCGAEAIAFLKVYGVVPAAAAFMLVYSALSNHLSKEALFYVTIAPFLAFYALFAFVLYPYRHTLQLEMFAPQDGVKVSYVYNLIRYWIFSVYYIVSELWGSAGVPLLFWQCANEVTPIHQAKRFYPLFAILGNMAPILSGQTMTTVSKYVKSTDVNNVFQSTLKILTSLMMFSGFIVIVLYAFVMDVTKKEKLSLVVADTNISTSTTEQKKKKEKKKMTLGESLQFLAKSTYLRYLAVMVISYGLTMEFTEIIWKATVKLAYPDKQEYMEFMGNYSTMVGILTVAMLLLGSNIIKYLGWKAGALATPLLMATLAAPFFTYITFGKISQGGSKTILTTALIIGTIQNILSKSTKYAFFDPTKEMAYIPLDRESKVKGKAAIDVLGARLGKSGGALAQQFLVMIFGSIMGGAPVLALLFYGVMYGWIYSVSNLSSMFEEVSDAKMKESQDAHDRLKQK